MEIEVRELKERKAELLLSDTNPPMANALRRVLIADVPSLAIEDVEFHLGTIGAEEEDKEYESSAPIFDEILAHRLGMVPIPTDLELFEYRDECEECGGEGCPNCTIIYSLNKKGPCTVYSGDLIPVGENDLKPVDDLIPLTKLDENQALLLYATAEMATAKEHTKWQPTSGVAYKYYPEIDIDQEKCDESCQECVEACPIDILEEDDGELVVTDVEECKLCSACEEACETGAIEINGREDKFILTFESDGSLHTREVLKKGLEVLLEKFGNAVELSEDI
ncbi:MAG: DNA-directed RNA polymerase subunit D [Candidatus Thermoplasmatota archaeon]|nr:DNA-directed RNA polymerase subunit D [Candidatus Thermoplasmatota archaeon]